MSVGAFVDRVAAGGVVTVHVRDHYVVQPTPQGEALPLFSDEAAAIRFAAAVIRSAHEELRLAVVTWEAAALPPLLEHARRTGWKIGSDWQVAAGSGGLAGPVEDPVEVLAHVPGVVPDSGAPVPEHQPRRAQGVRLAADGTVVVHPLG